MAAMNRPADRIPGVRSVHSPGPTHIPDAVLDAMHRQPMDLADPRVAAHIAACEAGLRRVAGSRDGAVFMYSTNGHGTWELVVENLLSPGGMALVPGTGHFSDGWAEVTEALGRRAQRTPWRAGWPIDPQAVEDALRADAQQRIEAVLVVHTDTASGVTSDLEAIRAAMDAARHPALLVVDAVASFAAQPLAFDDQRFDVLLGASQKGLMLPPGLGFVIVGPQGLARARRNPAPRYYWDFARREGPMSYQKFCGTPPLHLLFGLDAALQLLFAEGLEGVYARHARLATLVHAAVDGWRAAGGVDFYCADPAARSVSVTAVEVRQGGVDPESLRAMARERFDVAIAGGLGPLAGKVFRIGHLGDLSVPMVLGCLGGVEAALRQSGLSVGPGVQAAVDHLTRWRGRA
jgi:alanine-glyoxylate transaminase/serine-glyoxylate transaminase/serine-pyruvate transaminase